MPFPFVLPTVSHTAFTDYYSSSTHPSLPLAATSRRVVLREALKKHKRLAPQAQTSNLGTVLAALNEYIPYLFALDSGLSRTTVAEEEIDIVLQKELEVEWRPTLTASIPGREPRRIKLKSLEMEIFFTISTLGYTHSLIARSQLLSLYSADTPTAGERTTAIVSAMKSYLEANAAHTYLLNRTSQLHSPPAVADLSQPVLCGLAALTMAEATLITVTKDDPYPAAVTQGRNKNDKDWMFKDPDISSVRAHLFARLCLAAADHAAKARALIGKTNHVDQDLVKYMDNLRRTARSKACRFFAIDTELSGKLGESIAWLHAARHELGFEDVGSGHKGDSKLKAFAKLKRDLAERKEDKKIESAGSWGTDAGRLEEGRVIDMLEKKWVKMNDTINVQVVPSFQPLIVSMPSGREYHSPKVWEPPTLDEPSLMAMRGPPDPSEIDRARFNGDVSDEEADDRPAPVGAFPGTRADYAGSSSTYY